MGEEKMLEIKKTGIAFDEKELIKLEEIIIDQDETEALKFLKRAVFSYLVEDIAKHFWRQRMTLLHKESTPRGRGFVWSPLEGGQKPTLRSRGCWSNGALE